MSHICKKFIIQKLSDIFNHDIQHTTYDIRNKAFTLTETLVTVAIFSIMGVAVYATLLAGNTSMDTTSAIVELQTDLRIAMERMKADLSQAGTTSIIDVPADGSWYSTITFRVPESVDADGRIDWPEETIQYLLGGPSNKQLQRQIEENLVVQENKVIAQNIKTLQVRRQTSTPKIVEVSMHALNDGSVALRSVSTDIDFKVILRN